MVVQTPLSIYDLVAGFSDSLFGFVGIEQKKLKCALPFRHHQFSDFSLFSAPLIERKAELMGRLRFVEEPLVFFLGPN